MADYAKLKTRADCDEATTKVSLERKTYAAHDLTLEVAGDRAGVTATDAAARLLKVESEIAQKTQYLTNVGLTSSEIETATDRIAALEVQRTALRKRGRVSSGVGAFLQSVDADQYDANLAVLDTVLAGIAAHRATLSA